MRGRRRRIRRRREGRERGERERGRERETWPPYLGKIDKQEVDKWVVRSLHWIAT